MAPVFAEFDLSEKVKAMMRPQDQQKLIWAEAWRILDGSTMAEALADKCFVRLLDVNLWELRLGELLAEEWRPLWELNAQVKKLQVEIRDKVTSIRLMEKVAAKKTNSLITIVQKRDAQKEIEVAERELKGLNASLDSAKAKMKAIV